MILDLSQSGMTVVFEITEDGSVFLRDFSRSPHRTDTAKNAKWCPIAEVHISGENQNDHHGAKHTGTSGGFSLKYAGHKQYENESGTKLEFLLRDAKTEAVVHYQFFSGIAVLQSWVTVTNISEAPIGLEYVSSFSFTGLENDAPQVYIPHNTWCREVNWKSYTLPQLGLDRTTPFSMKRIAVSNAGTWSSKEYLPMGAFADTQSTLLWQIESNSSWQWEISDIADMLYLKTSGPNDQDHDWYKKLLPGECFETVKTAVCVGADFDAALAQMTAYRRAIFTNNEPNRRLPVIFNDYMNCLMGNPTEEKLFPIIDKAAAAGAEYFCIDAGWYADGSWWDSVGEWRPCAWRFPHGIKFMLDYIRQKGMIPGLWLEIEVMGIACPMLDQFDDSCFFMRHGKRVIDHGRYQLDFSNPKVRAHAEGVIDRLVNEYGVGYIKMDYNIEAGRGTEVDADSPGDGLLRHNRAYLAFMDSVMRKYPELIVENCSSGGMRMDYAMLRRHHLQSVSDQTNYKHTAVLAANAATAVLPEQAAVWSYPLASGDENEAAFNMINAMLLRIHLSGDIAHLSERQAEDVREGVTLYKTYREKLARAVPFYPLGLNAYGGDWASAGYRVDSEAYIGLWRLAAESETVHLPIRFAEDCEILYPSRTKAAVQTADDGILVTLPDPYSAVLLHTTDKHSSKK